MFNLEQSISQWRRQMQSAGVKNAEILDELEGHLREDVARRMQSGEREEQAFSRSVQDFGQASALKIEFAKLGGKKWRWIRKAKGIIAGALVPVPDLSTFTPHALRTLELAQLEAPRLHHGFVGTEHVLLGLLALEEGALPNVLKRLGVDRKSLKQQIENWISTFPTSQIPGPLPYTPRVQKSFRLAAKEAKRSKHLCIAAEHLFLGLLLEGDGVAGRILKNLHLSPETIRKEIARESPQLD
jgi:hypothetical protein